MCRADGRGRSHRKHCSNNETTEMPKQTNWMRFLRNAHFQGNRAVPSIADRIYAENARLHCVTSNCAKVTRPESNDSIQIQRNRLWKSIKNPANQHSFWKKSTSFLAATKIGCKLKSINSRNDQKSSKHMDFAAAKVIFHLSERRTFFLWPDDPPNKH